MEKGGDLFSIRTEEQYLADYDELIHIGGKEEAEDIRQLFKNQLEACGVNYFDFYRMHSQTAENFEYSKKTPCK